MKSKKRHHASSDESQESNLSDKSSSSSDSESEDSSESDHRYKKKRKHADSSESESNSEDQKRSKKRKHKKKKKKHSKKKRRSVSVISCDRFSISDGEIAAKKKKKHKHKTKRARTSTVSEDEDPAPRRLHSVIKERRDSSVEGSQPSRTYYQREYRRSASVENYSREQEVQRLYRGSSKDHKYPQENYTYERQRNESLRPPTDKYERYGEKFGPSAHFPNPKAEHYRQREYEEFKRPQYVERRTEEHYNKRPREEPYYREDPRANNRFNLYEGPKRREFPDNRDFRERRPPEPPRYRERGFIDKRDKLREERFSPERTRDIRRERPARLEKPPAPPPREPSKSPEVELKERPRRDVGGEREERADRSRSRYTREEREDRKERPAFDGKPRERKSRFTDADDNKEYSWGKVDIKKEGKAGPGDKEKPNFGLSGKLAADVNTVNGVVLKYSEPDDAKQPKRRWRFYPFKGDKALPILYIHRQSCFVLGRDKAATDIPLEHPSVSKQHAALQYRATPFTRPDGTQGRRVRPYIIDLDSANGTFVNNKKIEPRRYVELLERDVVKFGFSQREYVLLHENSKDDAQDDDQPAVVGTTDQLRRDKRVKEEIAADGE